MSDILTMLWKELKDVFFQGGWRSLIRSLIVVGIETNYRNLSPIATRASVGGPHANWNGSFALGPFLCDYQFHWRCYRRRARASYPGNLAGQPHARSSDPAGEASSHCPLFLGHGRAQFIAGSGVSRPVSYSGELDVLSTRSVRGCSRLKSASQCAWSKRGRADIAESIDGAAGTANSKRRHDSVCIRERLCTKSRACECCLLVNLFAVFDHCNGDYCCVGCDLAWIITGELPTFAFNLELRKHVAIQYDAYPFAHRRSARHEYQPLMWHFYKSHRRALFQLVRPLPIHSTTQNQVLSSTSWKLFPMPRLPLVAHILVRGERNTRGFPPCGGALVPGAVLGCRVPADRV